MRNYDFSPLFRSTIGFDRIQQLLDSVPSFDETAASYPPYNIEATGENAYRISMAVAGFGEDDLDIIAKENTLTITGKAQNQDKDTVYLHRGIAGRSFERRFQLADHIKVKGANLANGLLHVDLEREIPEALKPKTIKIESGQAKAIENKKKAA